MFKKYIQKLVQEEILKSEKTQSKKKDIEESYIFNQPEIEAHKYIELSFQKTAKDIKPLDVNGCAMDGVNDYQSDSLQKAWNFNNPLQSIILTHFATQGFIGYQACALLSQNWLINKCCSIPVDDAVRVDYDVSFTDDQIDKEEADVLTEIKNDANDDKKFDIKGICREFGIQKRIFGIAFCIPIVEDVDMSLPFNIDAIKEGSYHGMAVIDPYWIKPQFNTESQSDPASKDFYMPTWYSMPDGRLIHKSWFIRATYGVVPDILKPAYMFGGYPLTQLLYERVYTSEKVANEAYMLTMSKRLLVMDGNLNALILDQHKATEQAKLIEYFRDNYGTLIKDRESSVQQIDTNLADFDSVLMSQLQLCCSIADIPATKLLGTQPKGFNSTGEYETKQYNTLLAGIQNNDFLPIILKHFQLQLKSKYGIVKDICVKYKPIDVPTEKETAEINNLKADYYSKLAELGAVSGGDIRNNLIEDPSSSFNSLSEEEEPDDLYNDFSSEEENNSLDESINFDGGEGSGIKGHRANRPEKKDDKNLEKSKIKSKIKSSRKIVELPKEEFARVQHAFISDITNEQRKQKRLQKAIGNCVYTGILREDGTRDIIRKERIK